MKTKSVVIIMLICIVGGFCVGFFVKLPREEPEPIVEYVVDNSSAIKRLQIEEALITGMSQRQKLIVMETDLMEDIIIDSSFTDWDIFKKVQKISLTAIGKHVADLSFLSSDDIVFDDIKKEIVIKLLQPEIDSVTINEEETIFHSVEKGLLRFGEIKLTAAEQNEIYRQAKEAMTQKLKLDSMPEALIYTKSSVIDLVKKLLTATNVEIDEYSFDVVWK